MTTGTIQVVCRDVWALHLALLHNPPPAEDGHMQDDTQAVDVEGEGDNGSEEHRTTDTGEGEIEDRKSDDGAELEALLHENSELEESSDEDEDDEKEVEKGKESSRRGQGPNVYEKPASTIAVLMVACWTMRVPVLCRDFIRHVIAFNSELELTITIVASLIEKYELPYLDPVARQLLPGDMVVHLSKHNIQALSPYVG